MENKAWKYWACDNKVYKIDSLGVWCASIATKGKYVKATEQDLIILTSAVELEKNVLNIICENLKDDENPKIKEFLVSLSVRESGNLYAPVTKRKISEDSAEKLLKLMSIAYCRYDGDYSYFVFDKNGLSYKNGDVEMKSTSALVRFENKYLINTPDVLFLIGQREFFVPSKKKFVETPSVSLNYALTYIMNAEDKIKSHCIKKVPEKQAKNLAKQMLKFKKDFEDEEKNIMEL